MADLEHFKNQLLKEGFTGWSFPPPKPIEEEPAPTPRVKLKTRAGTKPRRPKKSKMTGDVLQLDAWVDGASLHLKRSGGSGRECVPDFSCCFPDLLAPRAVRAKYRRAYLSGDFQTMNAMRAFFHTAVAQKLAPALPVEFAEFRRC